MKCFRQSFLSTILLLLFIAFCSFGFAQTNVKGTVINEANQPLAGVTVSVKGTLNATSTDNKGGFSLSAPANAILVFTSVGFVEKDVPVNGQANINIQLTSQDNSLNEVVVTALGIKREKKSLGYSVQEVKGADLVKAREPNVISSLVGKVAGLRIATSTDLFANPGITLRGKSTIIVVDGVRINSDSWNLSADDIASFSVLKGPAASALYGSDGINGAIQITTKRGSQNKRGFAVEFNSSTQFQTGFNVLPKQQTEYGPGSSFEYSFVDGKGSGTNDADYYIWGPRFESQLIPQWNSPVDLATGELVPLPWLSQGKNNLKNFLRTGLLSSNNVAFSTNNDKGDIRFSFTQLYQRGLVPNTQLGGTNINFTGGLNLSKKFRLESNINYNKQYTPNYPDITYQPSSPIYALSVWGAANYDVRDLRNYWQTGKVGTQQRNIEYTQYNNPYFVANEELHAYYFDDLHGYVKLNYNVSKDLNVYLRTNVSTNYLNQSQRYPISTTQYSGDGGYTYNGGYNESFKYFWENNTDVLATYTKSINKDFSFKGSVGGNLLYRRNNYQYGHTNGGLLVPQLWTVQNTVNPPSIETQKSEYQRKSVYAYSDFGYKEMLFLSLTGRSDQSSTLPIKNNSYFYPSASLSAVVSQMVKLPALISFAKLRASYAKVGSDLGLYSLYPTYSTGTRWNGNPSLYYDGTLYDPGISPQFNKSLEFGTDIRFFKNRLGFDVSYFRNIEGPSIFYLPLSSSSGATSLQRNGLTYLRKGVELVLTANPVKSKNFSWDIAVNWSTQHRYLQSVYDTLQSYNRVNIGERTDKIFLTDFRKSSAGQIIYSASNGRPLFNNYSSLQGYADENWVAGIQNTFHYKNIGLSFSIDGRYGGKLVNYLSQKQWQGGAFPASANQSRLDDWNNRDVSGYTGTYTGEGVNVVSGSLEVDGNGNVISDDRKFRDNTKTVNWQSFASSYWGSSIANLVGKSYIKLREVTVTYNAPQKFLSKQRFFNAASVSLVARNLLYWAKDKNARNLDLDQFTSSTSDFQTPSVKSFGVNVNLTF